MKAPLNLVWEALNNPGVLSNCMPGCERIVCVGSGSFDVLLQLGIAAVKGRYFGNIKVTDQIPGSQYKIEITGSGSAGFVNAEGLIQLQETGDETVLEYSGQAKVGGSVARVGQRMIEGIARLLVAQFFKALDKAIIGCGETTDENRIGPSA